MCVQEHGSTGKRGIKRLHLTPLSNNLSVAATACRGGGPALSLPDSLSFIATRSLLLLRFAHPSVVDGLSGAGSNLHFSHGIFISCTMY